MIDTPLATLLGLEVPVLSAAMGGIATPELAAAVSNAGAGGAIGLFRLPPATVRDWVERTARLSSRAFGIGLIPEIQDRQALEAQCLAALDASPPNAFFQFYGTPPYGLVERLLDNRRRVLIQVGNIEDAKMSAGLGADALILQGTEAGGHLLGELPLASLHEAVSRLELGLPLVAAGGISTGAQLHAALQAGFAGALCGTLFVCASEAAAHPQYQACIAASSAADTIISEAFELGWPGRRHRVLRNRVATLKFGELPLDAIARTVVAGRKLPVWRFSAAVPTRDTEGRVGEMALYCGTGCQDVQSVKPAAQILGELRSQFLHAAQLSRMDVPSATGATHHVRFSPRL